MTTIIDAPARPAVAASAPGDAAKTLHFLDTRHGHVPREMSRASLRALSGHGDPGKFGRMFPTLAPLVVGDDALFELASAMKDVDPAPRGHVSPRIGHRNAPVGVSPIRCPQSKERQFWDVSYSMV